MWPEINSSAKLVAKRALRAIRSVGPEGCTADQSVTKHLEISSRPHAHARTNTDEHSPGARAAERSMHAQRFDIDTEPVVVKPGDAAIHTVLILRHRGQLIEAYECVSQVGLPAVVLKYAWDRLRLRSRRRRHDHGVGKNRRHKHVLRGRCRHFDSRVQDWRC